MTEFVKKDLIKLILGQNVEKDDAELKRDHVFDPTDSSVAIVDKYYPYLAVDTDRFCRLIGDGYISG